MQQGGSCTVAMESPQLTIEMLAASLQAARPSASQPRSHLSVPYRHFKFSDFSQHVCLESPHKQQRNYFIALKLKTCLHPTSLHVIVAFA